MSHAFWYEERDQTGLDIQDNHFGLLTMRPGEKPAYRALRAHLGR